MDKNINELYEFIDRAVKNRKYPPATGQALRAALKAFEPELNDDERNSLGKFRENIDMIATNIYNKKGTNVSAASLSTYKSRALKTINDYEKYGTDPIKMNGWAPPKPIIRQKKKSNVSEAFHSNENQRGSLEGGNLASQGGLEIPSGMHKLELQLRPDINFIFVLPYDLTSKEVKKIDAILGSLAINEDADEKPGLPEA